MHNESSLDSVGRAEHFACFRAAAGLTWIILAASLAGCSSTSTSTGLGSLNGACELSDAATLLKPDYTCDTGLVCNVGLSSPTCQTPNSGAVGSLCGGDQNCKVDLFCSTVQGGAQCQPRITEGQPCPLGVGCAAGLTCVRSGGNATACVAQDAGADASDGAGDSGVDGGAPGDGGDEGAAPDGGGDEGAAPDGGDAMSSGAGD
jgi:hypothetical protein